MAETAHWPPSAISYIKSPEMDGLRNIVEGFQGMQARIPIFRKSAEQRAWDDAVKWLEANKAAKEEWPFPW